MDTTLDTAAPLTPAEFFPVVTVEPAAEMTRGRLNANDSDKSNYFESA
ncbi:hypothetical protein [Streptomyces marincola]|nr:hypothetical protein [Streptomyces marincola]